MRSMKDSGIEWIGKIPQEWKVTKLGFLFKSIGSGTTPSSSDGQYYYGEHNWLQTGDLNDSTILSTEKTITDIAVKNYSILKLYSAGSLVVAMYGATIGKLGILGIPCYTNQACCVLNEPNNTNVKYVFYWLLCNRQHLVNLSLGGGQPNIRQSIIRAFHICKPEISEQNAIASFLDAKCSEFDALITAKEKTNALLKELRQSIIYEAVTKGLDPTAPMKDSGVEWIGEIPEGWGIAALKRLGTPVTGSTPSKNNPDYWEGNIPWVSSKDMKTDYLLGSEDHITQKAVDECRLTLFEPGTLIFCVRSGILRHTFPVAVSTLPVTINQDLRALNLMGNVNPAFLLYYMRGMNDTIVTLYQKIGATVESIEMNWFLYFPVALPPLNEQNHIVETLDSRCVSLDQLVEQNETTILQLKEYRQSLIYEAVTGKIEV